MALFGTLGLREWVEAGGVLNGARIWKDPSHSPLDRSTRLVGSPGQTWTVLLCPTEPQEASPSRTLNPNAQIRGWAYPAPGGHSTARKDRENPGALHEGEQDEPR